MTQKWFSGLECPTCSFPLSKVSNTRCVELYDARYIRRRRECEHCKGRWTTIEIPADLGKELLKMHQRIRESARHGAPKAGLCGEIQAGV